MPVAAALDFVGVAAVARLGRAALWTLYSIAMSTNVRWSTFTDVRVVWTASMGARFCTILDLCAGSMIENKARGEDSVQPSIITGA